MTGINIKKFLNSFSQNYNRQSSAAGTSANNAANVQSSKTQVQMDTSGPKLPAQNALSHIGQNIKTAAQNFTLNVLQNADRAAYLKEVLNFPKNLNEFVYMVQRNLTKSQVSKELAGQQMQQPQTAQAQPKTLTTLQSQILSAQAYLQNANVKTLSIQNLTQQNSNAQVRPQEGLKSQAQVQSGSMTGSAAQNIQNQPVQGQLLGQVVSNENIKIQRTVLDNARTKILAEIYDPNAETPAEEPVEIVLTKELQSSLKKLEIIKGGMINLGNISQMIQKNGKSAITKIIMTMTEASKSGISDLSQMKEMAKFINASISIAAENNPQKTLKLFLLLYLPWLPLEDGVNFDIEIEEKKNSETQESDSILVITVTTINYGTVRATLILETSNSVQVSLECAENFPKKELRLRIEKEQTYYSMESVLNFKTDENIKKNEGIKQAASVNMSQTTEINPFLLLMAHALIKHIIEIDNNKTLGLTTHEDKF